MARDKSEQKKREDPNAWQRFALKPKMADAIAIHQSHPAYLGSNYEPAAVDPGLPCEYPLLIFAPDGIDWQDLVPLKPGGVEIKPKGVLYLLVDGARKVAAAWQANTPIEARVIPLADAAPYIAHNNARCQAILDAELAEIPQGLHGAKDPYALGARADALLRQGEPIPAIQARLGISKSRAHKAVVCFRAWRNMGSTPLEANIASRALDPLRAEFLRVFKEASGGYDPEDAAQKECLAASLRALVAGFCTTANELRGNHAALNPGIEVPHFPESLLGRAAEAMARVVAVRQAHKMFDLSYEALGRAAVTSAVFARFHPDLLTAVLDNRILYESARRLASSPSGAQKRALQIPPEDEFWAKPDMIHMRAWQLSQSRKYARRPKASG